MMLATGFYVGNIPFAPGTFGTVLGVGLAYFLSLVSLPVAMLIIVALTGFSVWISDQAEKQLGTTDPGCIVIDEIVGVMAALVGLPYTLWPVVASFVVFRCLDIAKPFPISWCDKKLPGGAGIVADDVVAGVMTNLIIRIAIMLI